MTQDILKEFGDEFVVKTRHYRNVMVDRPRHLDMGIELIPMSQIRADKVLRDNIVAKGGKTEVAIYTKDGNKLVECEALCSKNDNFNRSVGRAIALGRAAKKILQREARSKIEEGFVNMEATGKASCRTSTQ